ncbi:hypothetical protein ALC57_12414 [Trachymyrmex cornetzi]|uniref:Uncharacterized protein n=1 Tax=Trachymyrmex cornetzi TaxID=471704 RepID=A0A195DR25_9HYME|nr:hypothetical protein ALC57_12414 [Trachymyrmex cornetzi]
MRRRIIKFEASPGQTRDRRPELSSCCCGRDPNGEKSGRKEETASPSEGKVKRGGREEENPEERERWNRRNAVTRMLHRASEEDEDAAEREGEKEMQRLPYNGAPRAHKLRHNVISSSLFNERWQHAAHTFYPGVLVVPASVGTHLSLPFSLPPPLLSLSPSFYLFHDALFAMPHHRSPQELVASHALRCVVKSRSQT